MKRSFLCLMMFGLSLNQACAPVESAHEAAAVHTRGPRFLQSAAELETQLRALQELEKKRVAEVLALDSERATFADAFGRIDEIFTEANRLDWQLLAILDGSRSAEKLGLGDRAVSAQAEVKGVLANVLQDEALFRALERVATRNAIALGRDDVRLRDSLFRKFRDAGIELPPEKRVALQQARDRATALGYEFEEVIGGVAQLSMDYTADELAGVPAGVLERFRNPAGGYTVSFAERATYSAIMENAVNPETRRRTFTAYQGYRNPEADAILREILGLRLQIAHLMGYDSWANYITARYLAGDAATADRFVQDLGEGFRDKFMLERAELAALKERDGLGGNVEIWDVGYYLNKLKSEKYTVDSSEIAEFFEFEATLPKILDLFEELLQVRIEPLRNVALPTPESRAYVISDAVTGHLFGHLFLDLQDRPDKRIPGASYFLQPRIVRDGRLIQPALSFITTRAPRSIDGKPALLGRGDLDVIFHELGHSFHALFATSEWGLVNDYMEYPTEYSEVPSMMFGRLSRDPKVLGRLASHHRDPARTLPLDLLQKIEQANRATIVHDEVAPLLAKSRVDMAIHEFTRPEDIPAELGNLSGKEYAKHHYPYPAEVNMAARFAHMSMDICAAGYYGYVWSDAIGMDLLAQIRRTSIFDRQAWMDYRTAILEAGHTRDGLASARAFLGRDWNVRAFLDAFLK